MIFSDGHCSPKIPFGCSVGGAVDFGLRACMRLVLSTYKSVTVRLCGWFVEDHASAAVPPHGAAASP